MSTKKGRPAGAKTQSTCPHCGKMLEPPTGNPYQAARLRAGLTIQEAAKKARVGYTTIWNYEDGTRHPAMDIGLRLATAYGCTLDELAGAVAPQA